MRSTSPIPIEVDKPSERADPNPNDYFDMNSHFGDGRVVKMEVDYSAQVDVALPKAQALAKVSLQLSIL